MRHHMIISTNNKKKTSNQIIQHIPNHGHHAIITLQPGPRIVSSSAGVIPQASWYSAHGATGQTLLVQKWPR